MRRDNVLWGFYAASTCLLLGASGQACTGDTVELNGVCEPCKHNGIPNTAGTLCVNCDDQYEGVTCETHKCSEKGTYLENKCVCSPMSGFGDKCEKTCTSGYINKGVCYPCINGVHSIDFTKCECSSAKYSGLTCDLVCNGNGDVVEGSCSCTLQHTGEFCGASKCNDGGSVAETNATCECLQGRIGEKCAGIINSVVCDRKGTFDVVDETCSCNEFSTASEGSCECVTNAVANASGQCACLPGYSSERCDVFTCLHGGTTKSGDANVCDCLAGYSGSACQTLDDVRNAIRVLAESKMEGLRNLGKLLDSTIPNEVMSGPAYTLFVNAAFKNSDAEHLDNNGIRMFLESFCVNHTVNLEEVRTELGPDVEQQVRRLVETNAAVTTTASEQKRVVITALDGGKLVFTLKDGVMQVNGLNVNTTTSPQIGKVRLVQVQGYIIAPSDVQPLPKTATVKSSARSPGRTITGMGLLVTMNLL